MNKRTSLSTVSILIMLCMQITSACTKDDQHDDLAQYIGSYKIESIYWTGEFKDLNGDGRGTREFLDEYRGFAGFVKDWIKGTVERVDDTTISFHSTVPVYNTDKVSNKSEIKYYDISISAEWHGEWGIPGFVTETYRPVVDESVIGMEKAELDRNKIKPDSYELHVYCSFPDEENGEISGTMIFYFTRLE